MRTRDLSKSTDSEASLTLSRLLAAPRQRVFKAWTDPDEIGKWWNLGEEWGPSVAEVDLRVGGHFRIGIRSLKGDKVHSVRGVYREVVHPERLVYTWVVENPKAPEIETLVTVEFRNHNGSTELVLTHQLLKKGELRDSVEMGWSLVLEGLTRFLLADNS